ncbi:MAG TPA: hypothetical protein VGA69_01560 [Nitriliruptorales bacterium]
MNAVQERTRTLLVAAAVVVTVAATATILAWGLIALPSFPSLQAESDADVPGRIAYLDTQQRADLTCVRVVAASGAYEREVTCYDGFQERWPERVGWTSEGELVVTVFGPVGPRFEILDEATGEVLRSGTWQEDGFDGRLPPAEPGGSADDVEVRHQDGHLTVTIARDGQRTTAVDVEAPRSYTFWERRWSPDGAWLSLVDSEQQLIIVPADASDPPRLLAQHVRGPSWWIDGVGPDVPIELP